MLDPNCPIIVVIFRIAFYMMNLKLIRYRILFYLNYAGCSELRVSSLSMSMRKQYARDDSAGPRTWPGDRPVALGALIYL